MRTGTASHIYLHKHRLRNRSGRAMDDNVVDLTSQEWHEGLQGKGWRLALEVLEGARGRVQRLKDKSGNFLVRIALA